jgi:hypothetical protein
MKEAAQAPSAAEVPPPAVEEPPPGEAAVLPPTPEEEAAAAAAAAAGEGAGEEEFDELLGDAQTLAPRDLAAKIEASPELKAALEKSPEIRDLLFSNARNAAKAKPYTDRFGSPEEADAVIAGHQAYSNIAGLLGGVKREDIGSTQAVIDAMRNLTALRDDDGNPLKDEQGNVRTDGTVGRFMRNFVVMTLGNLERQAKQSGDDETLAALDHTMERLGFRAPSSAGQGESEELKAQRTALTEQQRQLDAQRDQGRKEALDQHDQQVFSKIQTGIDDAVKSILDRATGLTPFARESADEKIRAALGKAIMSSPAYQTELDQIVRMPVGAKREAAHVALANRYMQSHLSRVAKPILSAAGITIAKKAAANATATAARTEAARSEVRGSAAPTAASRAPATEAKSHADLKAELTQKFGREPSLDEMLKARISPAFARSA